MINSSVFKKALVDHIGVYADTNKNKTNIAVLKINTSTWHDVRLRPLQGNDVIQNSFGHSKVVLPSGIVGTVLLR